MHHTLEDFDRDHNITQEQIRAGVEQLRKEIQDYKLKETQENTDNSKPINRKNKV